MLPGLLQLAKFRKICIFDEWALGRWEKGATQVIRKCLISFSSLYQSWWLLRTAQLQGGVLAPRKQAEQQSWAVFSASARKITLLLKVPSANVHTVHPAAYLPREQCQANTDSWKIPAPVGGWAAGIILGHRKWWMNAGMGMPCPRPAWSLCHVEAPRCFIMPCFLTEEQIWLPLCVLL